LLSQHFGDKGWFQERHREQRSVAIGDDGEGIVLQPAKKTIIDLPSSISALGLFENSNSQPAHWLASGSRSTLVPSSGFGSIVLNEWRTWYDPDKDVVFLPSKDAAAILNEATGEDRPTQRATAYLLTLSIKELRKSKRSDMGGRGWIWTGHESESGQPAVPLCSFGEAFVAAHKARGTR
jgi:hypothetical protein